jgi:hypothetical protein
MDRLIWIVLAVAFGFGVLMIVVRRRPSGPRAPAPEVIKVDLADRD